MNDTRVLLGVDAGNSKTHVAVADLDGRVRAVVAGAGASPQLLGLAGSWSIIRRLTASVLAEASDPTVAAAAYAVAGLDFPAEEAAFAASSDAGFPAAATVVRNDAFAVLRSGLAVAGTDEGIAVVVGAGMNCVGRSGAAEVRFPALGTLSGDWGGGLMIGVAAVGAACRVEDGHGPATRLATAVPAALGFDTPHELLLALHTGALDTATTAALTPTVLTLADEGDAVSRRLVERQADEVLALVDAAARRLGDATGQLPVIVDGSVLKAGCRTLDDRIRAGVARHPLVVPPFPPVHGAVLLARDALEQQPLGR